MNIASIQRAPAKVIITTLYKVFYEGHKDGYSYRPKIYVGFITVHNNKIISVDNVKGVLYNEKWFTLDKYNGFDFERDVVIDIVKELCDGPLHKIEYHGFDFPEEKVDIETSVDSKYIKNSLLRILEAPVYSIDDQIFNSFMKRG